MIKQLTLLLFTGFAFGQERIDDLLIKKAENSTSFKSGQKLIIRYTNEELDVVYNTEGDLKSVHNNFLMISTGYTIDEKIPLSSIKKITVPSKIPTNVSFIKGSYFGAGIVLIPISIMAYKDPLNLMVVPFAIPLGAVLGGLTSYILPKFRRTKVYLIQKNEWKIVND